MKVSLLYVLIRYQTERVIHNLYKLKLFRFTCYPSLHMMSRIVKPFILFVTLQGNSDETMTFVFRDRINTIQKRIYLKSCLFFPKKLCKEYLIKLNFYLS